MLLTQASVGVKGLWCCWMGSCRTQIPTYKQSHVTHTRACKPISITWRRGRMCVSCTCHNLIPYSSAFACTCIREDEQTALIGSIVNASWLVRVYICVRVYTCGRGCMYAFVCRAFHVLQLSAQQSISRDKYSEQRNVYGKQKHVRCAQTNVDAARFC